ncbi:MAG: putative transposase, partial [Archaeoglobaceae archaeon]|nr:putative transposase [Archaeoglobaceae archaeon]
VPGDLKGTRKQDKGRRFNRKLNAFPYYRLSKFTEYKASWEGIAVIKIKENGTSKHRSRHVSNLENHGGRFFCNNCKTELNADYNGAMNILKRDLGYMSGAGAGLTQPEPGRMKLCRQTGNLPALAVESVKCDL